MLDLFKSSDSIPVVLMVKLKLSSVAYIVVQFGIILYDIMEQHWYNTVQNKQFWYATLKLAGINRHSSGAQTHTHTN